ncbi:MAG: polysaccharide deacetylase family protein [Bacteroidetes bacterium]|nr:polysaccharide deacetylase family protein [Bacteroidota bacterium]
MKIFLFLLLSVSTNLLFGQIEVTNWYDDKKCAVVMTFDDWLEGHEKIVVPAIVKRKLPATFFVSVQGAKWRRDFFDQMRVAQANGSEIANHTITHPSLPSISLEKAKAEIDDARKIIMDSVPGAECLTFAYPMGTKSNEVIDMVKKEHIAARTVNPFNENNISYDFVLDSLDYYRISTVRVWHIVTLEKIVQWLDYAEAGGGMLTFMMHSVYNDKIEKGWDAMPEEFLTGMLDTLKSREDSIWITALASAVKYHQEKKACTIKILKEEKSKMEFILESPLDPLIYNQKLTIKMRNPDCHMEIRQDGLKVDFTFSANGEWVYANVLPGKKIKVKYWAY